MSYLFIQAVSRETQFLIVQPLYIQNNESKMSPKLLHVMFEFLLIFLGFNMTVDV